MVMVVPAVAEVELAFAVPLPGVCTVTEYLEPVVEPEPEPEPEPEVEVIWT